MSIFPQLQIGSVTFLMPYPAVCYLKLLTGALSVPLTKMMHRRPHSDSALCRLKKADDVSVQIAAATIANLRQLQNRRAVVILMDGGDGRAIAVAKALRACGCQRPYALEGGFRCKCAPNPCNSILYLCYIQGVEMMWRPCLQVMGCCGPAGGSRGTKLSSSTGQTNWE